MYDFMFRGNKDPQKPTYGVGFFVGIEEQVPGGVLLRAALDVVQEQTSKQPEEAFLTELLIKAVKEMTFAEFQQLEPYLFRFELGQKNAVPEVSSLKASQEEFERIRADPEEFFLKQPFKE